jgi:hypothetical protein
MRDSLAGGPPARWFVIFLLRSVLLEETNKLTTPRPQDRTLGGLHTAAERGQPAEQEQRQRTFVVATVVVLTEPQSSFRGGGALTTRGCYSKKKKNSRFPVRPGCTKSTERAAGPPAGPSAARPTPARYGPHCASVGTHGGAESTGPTPATRPSRLQFGTCHAELWLQPSADHNGKCAARAAARSRSTDEERPAGAAG